MRALDKRSKSSRSGTKYMNCDFKSTEREIKDIVKIDGC